MLHNQPISAIMTDDVQTAKSHQSITEIIEMFEEFSVDHLPVVSGGKLVGMISSKDIMNVAIKAISKTPGENCENLQDTRVSVVMEEELIILNQDSTVHDAAELLAGGQMHSVPIVNDDNLLVGIVTSTDLINYLLNEMEISLT